MQSTLKPLAGASADASFGNSPPLWYSVVHTAGTNALAVPLGFIATLIVARALGPEQKGAYDLVLATVALLTTTLGLSLPAGITFVVARQLASLRVLAARLIPFALFQGVAAFFVLQALRQAGYVSVAVPASLGRSGIIAASIAVIFVTLTSYSRAILVGAQRIVEVNRLELLGRVATIGLLGGATGLALAQGQRPTALLLIWVYVAGRVTASLWFGRRVYARPPSSESHDSGLREAVKFAVPSYAANVAQFLNYRLDLFLVGYMVGIRGVGLYALAVTLAQLIWVVSKAVAVVLLPRTAATRERYEENVARTARASRLLLWLSICFSIVVALSAPLLLPLVFGDAFRGSLSPLLFLLPGVAVFTLANVLSAYLAGIGEPKWNTLASTVGLAGTIVLNILLIPLWGITGAAVASTASYSLSTCVLISAFRSKTGVRLHRLLLPARDDVEFAGSVTRGLVARLSPR